MLEVKGTWSSGIVETPKTLKSLQMPLDLVFYYFPVGECCSVKKKLHSSVVGHPSASSEETNAPWNATRKWGVHQAVRAHTVH